MRVTKTLLAEYLDLQAEKKAIDERLSAIRDALIERGSGDVDEYRVRVTQSTTRRLAGLKEIEDASPKLLAALEKAKLVHEIAATRVTVKLTEGAE